MRLILPLRLKDFLSQAKAACDEKRCNPANKTNAHAYLKWCRGVFTTHKDPDTSSLFTQLHLCDLQVPSYIRYFQFIEQYNVSTAQCLYKLPQDRKHPPT